MDPQTNITIVFLGDVIGKPGRRVVTEYVRQLSPKPDLIIANVENAAHGFGTTESNLEELRQAGIKAFTGGNHTFDRKEIHEFIDRQQFVVRPANYPDGTPGCGSCIVELDNGLKVGIINLLGRVFMEPLESPFLVADELLKEMRNHTNTILLDMHAEATAEKVAMGWYVDGRVSAVVGTHTHVQTADERILPNGTAFITDVGCCGPRDGVIGMDKEGVFRRMIKQLPTRFEVAPGPASASGVILKIDIQTGKTTSIDRIRYDEQNGLLEEPSSPSEVTAQSAK